MPHSPQIAKSILLFALAGLFLSTLDALAKLLVRDYPVWWVVWARYAGHLLVVLPLVLAKVGGRFWRTRQPILQIARSTLLVVATMAYFSGLRYLPLAEASAIAFLTPMIVVLLSGPMLGEVIPRARWAAIAVGFAGVLVVTRPGAAAFHPAALLMLGMALSNALYQLLTRKLRGDSAYTTLFYSALPGTVIFTGLLPFLDPHPLPGIGDTLLFLALGVLAGVGHWCLITAFLRAQASRLTPFGYLHIVWPLGYGWLLFGQFPDHMSILGILIILAGGVWLAWQERQRSREPVAPPVD